jgi:predicted DNA-binding transcriptional regulator AlpA
MSTNSPRNGIDAGSLFVRQAVSISRWVNEPYPDWDRILTAHDVARLIRRPPWMLSTLAAVGQFPRKQQFRGKKIGWLKADILEWMARTRRSPITTTSDKAYCPRRRQANPSSQHALPLKHPSSPALGGHRALSTITGVSP